MTRALEEGLIVFGLAPSLAVALALGACSYDWSAPSFDGGAPDASADAALEGSSDASGDSSADSDANGDAGADAADCASLLAQASADEPAAKACKLPDSTACTNELTDECGCSVVVGNANVPAVNTYADALQRFHASCSKPASCPPSCPVAQKGLCVADAPDAGTLHCAQ